jgi:hypothetical protein
MFLSKKTTVGHIQARTRKVNEAERVEAGVGIAHSSQAHRVGNVQQKEAECPPSHGTHWRRQASRPRRCQPPRGVHCLAITWVVPAVGLWRRRRLGSLLGRWG